MLIGALSSYDMQYVHAFLPAGSTSWKVGHHPVEEGCLYHFNRKRSSLVFSEDRFNRLLYWHAVGNSVFTSTVLLYLVNFPAVMPNGAKG
jgi:hypothetical protein